jgi:hypothetical protein
MLKIFFATKERIFSYMEFFYKKYGIIFCHVEMNECNIDDFFG